MPVSIKKILFARTTTLVLILFILGSVVLSFFFPQRFATPRLEINKWSDAHPFLAVLHGKAGFDHIFTTPWFALLLFFFIVSLAYSAAEQYSLALKRTFSLSLPLSSQGFRTNARLPDIKAVCRGKGYLPVSDKGDCFRFVRNPWGYWGNFLLHLGIALVILGSLLIVLTQKRGLLKLAEGEVHSPAAPWESAEQGLIAGSFTLPDAVRVDKVKTEFHADHKLKRLAADLSFLQDDASISRQSLEVNRVLKYKGFTVYQSLEFGHAFFVRFTDRRGVERGAILQIKHPESLETAGYGEFRMEWLPFSQGLKVKYYVDAEKKSIKGREPLLVLRLVEKQRVAGQAALQAGQSGELGPYKVELVKVAKWAGLIFVEIRGMIFIFTGFLVIILGGCLNYFTPPRELVVKKAADGFLLYWKAARFGSFYSGERDEVFLPLSVVNGEEG